MEIARRFVKIAEVRSAHADIGSVTLYFGGDAVEGEQIYGGQHWDIEVGVGEQSLKYGPEMHARLAAYIAQNVKCHGPVRVRCVTGNHGRVGAINLPASPKTNWDRVCYETCRMILDKQMPGAFDYAIADDWFIVDRLPGGWGIFLTHGDMISGGGSGQSIIAKCSAWAENIPEPWDYALLAHFHRAHAYQTKGGTRDIYLNGSTESDDSDFVRGRMGAGGRPCQRMFVLTEEHGIIEAPIIYPERRVPNAGR